MDEGNYRSARLQRQGKSHAEISKELGLPPSTVRTWIENWQCQDAHCRRWLAGLPPRVARSLLANGFETREAVAEAYRHGLICPGKTPGIGKQGYAQIAAWLGQTPPPLAAPADKPKCIAVTLMPETQAALKRLMRCNESPQAAINRIIREFDQ